MERLSRADVRETAPETEVREVTVATAVPIVQRAPLPGAETSAPAFDQIAQRAVSQAGAGAAVDGGLGARMQRATGADLGGVRVHEGEHAARAASQMDARAFTYGRDVFLGRGESASDQQLMAHELTHTVQQGGAPVVQRERTRGHSEEPAEREADAVAAAVTKKPDIEATDEAMGDHVAKGMDTANQGPHSDSEGIHYAHNFKRFYPRKWKEDMWTGFANPDFFEKRGFMDWVLKPGKSASEGIRAWLKGLTIAECLSTVIALEIDALRAAIGDDKFDERHGKSGSDKVRASRLRIRPGTQGTPVGGGVITSTEAADKGEAGTIANRPAKRGEWYYFYNHPKYLLKHPGGAWQGENALCMGEVGGVQMWSGLGASNVTEDEMMDQMVRAYNAPRTDRDLEILEDVKKHNGGKLPKEYDAAGGEFADAIDKEQILKDPPYTIDGTTRKGGFMAEAGMKLDAAVVKKLRG